MSIKLVALDLDHTLLNDEKRISDFDLEMINKARSLGVHFTIATGRMYAATKDYGNFLKINLPVITYQGSLIKTLITGEELLHLRISREIALEAISLASKKNIHSNIYDGDKLYVFNENELIKRYRKVNKIEAIIDPEIDKNMDFMPTKVVFVEDSLLLLNALQKKLEKKYSQTYDVTRSLPHLLELGHKDATKSKALAFLAEKLDIKQEETMAVGDGLNDLDMIKWAGIGVAMDNSPDVVKQEADWVTTCNNNSGVGKAIERFIIKGQ